ncbi:MAG: efflux RND transporter periplasmic adaptor subunit [Alphaproteobacteria bacterium]|nr:efflux RND transporter periplasmic adaptor subunit [Alphaproteobacteria bacterium]
MRLKGSIILAMAIAIAATGWILSGQFGERPATANDSAPIVAAEKGPVRVRVHISEAADYVARVRASGQTEAARTVEIRAEIDARVVAVETEKGSAIAVGARIVTLDAAERPAQLARAKARVTQREIEYEASSKLAKKGFQAETTRARAFADLEDARAYRREIEVEVARTRIDAPFAGVLDRRPVEIGDYVRKGDHIATLVELDPLLITAQFPEHQAPALEPGMTGTARFSNGIERPGVVRYVAAVADPQTRTFRIELEIGNPGNRLGEGLTAELEIPLPTFRAHRVSPSIFRLDPAGHIGVMTVDADNRARFTRVTLIGGDDTGAWITGLPERVHLITVGQELVDVGEPVMPVFDAAVPAGPSGATS